MPTINMNELDELMTEESVAKAAPKRKRPHAASRFATRKNKLDALKKHDEQFEVTETNTQETKEETIMATETTTQTTAAEQIVEPVVEQTTETVVEETTETVTEEIKETIMEETKTEQTTSQETVKDTDLVIVKPILNHFRSLDITKIKQLMFLATAVKHGGLDVEQAITSGDFVEKGVMEKILGDEYDLNTINKHNIFNSTEKPSVIDDLKHIAMSLVAIALPSRKPVEPLTFPQYAVVVDENASKSLRVGFAKSLMRHIADKLGLKTVVSEDYTVLSLTIQLRHTTAVFRATTNDEGEVVFSVEGLNNEHVRLVDSVNPADLTITQFARLITGVAAARF